MKKSAEDILFIAVLMLSVIIWIVVVCLALRS